MKTHRVVFREVDRDKYNEVAAGLKTIETRAATVKFKDIAKGDKLKFVCGQDSFEKLVASAKHYSSIDEMLAELPYKKILPSAKNRADVYKIYWSFPSYQKKIENYGIMAFRLR
jgi:ASC-1-like (ASCH) protein